MANNAPVQYDATASFTIPGGVPWLEITECRGGGAGGSNNGASAKYAGGGGGGGGFAKTAKMEVLPGKTYTFTVGAEVAAETAGNPSTILGENSTGANSEGGKSTTTQAAGVAGNGTLGDTKYIGGAGGAGSATINQGGGGGLYLLTKPKR